MTSDSQNLSQGNRKETEFNSYNTLAHAAQIHLETDEVPQFVSYRPENNVNKLTIGTTQGLISLWRGLFTDVLTSLCQMHNVYRPTERFTKEIVICIPDGGAQSSLSCK